MGHHLAGMEANHLQPVERRRTGQRHVRLAFFKHATKVYAAVLQCLALRLVNRHGPCQDEGHLGPRRHDLAGRLLGLPRLGTREKVAGASVDQVEADERPARCGPRLRLAFLSRGTRRTFGAQERVGRVVFAVELLERLVVDKIEDRADRSVGQLAVHVFDQHDLRALFESDAA